MPFIKRLFGLTNKNYGNNLPDGWTETKISADTYVTHITQQQKDKWTIERHKRDNVKKLLNKNGFHIKQSGRAGTIYYVSNRVVSEIEFEISGVKKCDILIYFDRLEEWILPVKKLMTTEEKAIIREKLKSYLEKENINACW